MARVQKARSKTYNPQYGPFSKDHTHLRNTSSPTAIPTPPHTNPGVKAANRPLDPPVLVVAAGKLVTTTVGPPIPPSSLIVLVVGVVVVALAATTTLDVAVMLVGVGSGVVYALT